MGVIATTLALEGTLDEAAAALGEAGMLLVELVPHNIPGHFRNAGAAHILAEGDEFHFRRDHSLPRVPKLGDRMPLVRAQGAAAMEPKRRTSLMTRRWLA